MDWQKFQQTMPEEESLILDEIETLLVEYYLETARRTGAPDQGLRRAVRLAGVVRELVILPAQEAAPRAGEGVGRA